MHVCWSTACWSTEGLHFSAFSLLYVHVYFIDAYMNYITPPCDARRKVTVKEMYSAGLSLLAEHMPGLFSLVPQLEYKNHSPGSSVVIVVLNPEIHPHKPHNTTAQCHWKLSNNTKLMSYCGVFYL